MDVSGLWQKIKTPVILLALLVLLIVGVRWGLAQLQKPIPEPPPDPCIETPIADGRLQSNQVSVVINNGSELRGKAGEVRQALEAKGFNVVAVGNTPEPAERTQIIGNDPEAPEVNLVASHVVGAERVGNGQPDHMVEIIIGSNYDGLVADAPDNLEVDTPSLCLPAPPEEAV